MWLITCVFDSPTHSQFSDVGTVEPHMPRVRSSSLKYHSRPASQLIKKKRKIMSLILTPPRHPPTHDKVLNDPNFYFFKEQFLFFFIIEERLGKGEKLPYTCSLYFNILTPYRKCLLGRSQVLHSFLF